MPLYESAAATQDLVSVYVAEVAPSLAAKAWASLPEDSQRLLRRGLFLDWFDLLTLTAELTGPARLPEGLPNPSSKAAYASKFLFFRYTLGVDAAAVRGLASALLPSAVPPPSYASDANADASTNTHRDGEVHGGAAPRVRPLVLWLCVGTLLRVVSECLGDVLTHVGHSLQQHAQMAAEEAAAAAVANNTANSNSENCNSGGGEHDSNTDVSTAAAAAGCPGLDLDGYLDRLALHRPHSAGVHRCPPQARMRPKRMRIRLLPYEAFPSVFRCLPTPARAATARATQMEERRQHRHRGARTTTSSSGSNSQVDVVGGSSATAAALLESPFAAVLGQSPLAAKHVERATAALEWSTAVLAESLRMVQGLPRPSLPVGSFPLVPPTGNVAVCLDGVGHTSDTSARRVGAGDDGVLSESGTIVVAQQRAALCDRYVRSRVQLLVDSAFTHIPWGELESAIEPLFSLGSGDTSEVERSKYSEEAELFAMALAEESLDGPSCDDCAGTPTVSSHQEEDGSEKGVGAEDEHEGVATATAEEEEEEADGEVEEEEAVLTEAELQMRAAMTGLQVALEGFHIVLADVLDAHERFFGPSDTTTTTTTTGGGASVSRSGAGDGQTMH